MPEKELRKPSKQITETLAKNLLAFRRKQQLSQEDLAELCNLHRTYIGSVERGERNVTLSTLEVLAQAVGVSVPKLLTPIEHDDKTDT
ncbi:MAG: helix-turn-helix transcriptional regulator [Chitinophagaceae bacterium]|nr:helix-turn-helix transcriptional regulator [Anaerolineae bacterium]